MSFYPARILLATDGSEEARRAARMAIEQANKTGSELHVVHVGATVLAGFVRGEMGTQRPESEAQEVLDSEVRWIEDSGGVVAESYCKTGDDSASQIVNLAEGIGAGLIVVGSRGLTTMKRMVLGSASESIVRHAHCPVLVVRED